MAVFDNIFTDFLEYMEDIGVYEVVLPFLLIFVIVYGILQKVKLFGKKASDKLDPIIALVIAFFFVRVDFISDFLGVFFPKISIWLIVLFSFLLLGGIFGLSSSKYHGLILFLMIFAGIFVVIWAVTSTAEEESLPEILPDFLILDDEDWWAVVIVVGIIFVVMWAIGGGTKGDEGESKLDRIARTFGREFGKEED